MNDRGRARKFVVCKERLQFTLCSQEGNLLGTASATAVSGFWR